MDDEVAPAFFIGGLAGFFVGILFMAYVSKTDLADTWKTRIANHTCAEFYLDAKHDRQWRWLNEEDGR